MKQPFNNKIIYPAAFQKSNRKKLLLEALEFNKLWTDAFISYFLVEHLEVEA
jgi:hypothetical protein